jgi:hypothetical protein
MASPDTQVFGPATDKDFVPNSAHLNPKNETHAIHRPDLTSSD